MVMGDTTSLLSQITRIRDLLLDESAYPQRAKFELPKILHE